MKVAVKALLITIGTLSIGLGVIGIVVPLLPTTPLILLGAVCYLRSSEKLYHKLIKNKWLGAYIKDFHEKKGISRKNKLVSLCLMWLSISGTVLFSDVSILVGSILIIIAVTVSAYILSFETL
jgi:uncharacterized protein